MVSKQGISCLLFTLLGFNVLSQTHSQWFRAKTSHGAKILTTDQLNYVASLTNMQSFDAILDPILLPRVVGTTNHALVRQYLIAQMKSVGWNVETDQFSSNTPHGRKQFENVIATLDPNAPRRLVLACHYDSKYTREGTFIGATDSAVPCAMMITLAKDLAPKLDKLKSIGSEVTLQFIFFDGEEAFRDWNSRDSLYGSRNLASKWEKTDYPVLNRDGTNELHRMDLMVLLDLLGTRTSTFYSYVASGQRWFTHAANIEMRLRSANLLNTNTKYFSTDFAPGGIEDDHVPFMKRGVPILHLIPSPFPSEWHTDADNKAALDYLTVDDLNKILRVFVIEYLQMDI